MEAYDESGDNQSDDEPPEETAIIKKSALLDNKSLTEHSISLCSASEVVDKEVYSSPLVKNDSEAVNTEVKIKSSKVNNGCEKADPENLENGQKRKRNVKKEFKPIKKSLPLRTPRTEIVERKGALLEAVSRHVLQNLYYNLN